MSKVKSDSKFKANNKQKVALNKHIVLTDIKSQHQPSVLNKVDQVCLKVQQHCTVTPVLVQRLYNELFQVRASGVGVRLKTRVP